MKTIDIVGENYCIWRLPTYIDKANGAKCSDTFYNIFTFYNGGYITHEILSEKRFEKILEDKEV